MDRASELAVELWRTPKGRKQDKIYKELFKEMLPVTRKIRGLIKGNFIPHVDVSSIIHMSIIQTAKSYNPELGSYKNYSFKKIYSNITDEINKNRYCVSMPRITANKVYKIDEDDWHNLDSPDIIEKYDLRDCEIRGLSQYSTKPIKKGASLDTIGNISQLVVNTIIDREVELSLLEDKELVEFIRLYQEGYSYGEIAEMMGCGVGYITRRLKCSTAKNKLSK
jgi:RNA polymerase sigma factor (sigma-70 family)